MKLLYLRGLCTGLLSAALALATPAALASRADDTLVAVVAREILVLDNFNSTSRENEIISLLVDDALFYIDPATQKAQPLVARSYRYLDPTTLEVTLRDDVQFHDGSKLGVDDVVYTFKTIIDPDNKAQKAGTFRRWLAGVEPGATPGTVVFHLKEPNPLVLDFLATGGRVVKKGTYDRGDGTGGLDVEAQSGKLIGTGPYKVVSFLPGRDLVLEKYAGYRGDSPKANAAISKIVFRVIPDYATQAAEIISGGAQWAYNVPTDIAESMAGSGQAVFQSSPSMRIGFIVLDAAGRTGADNPFTKLQVRQALNYAVDRAAIAKSLLRGSAAPADTPCLPVQFACAQDVPKYAYDPARAKRLLAEAGYPNGISFDLWASREQDSLEAVVAMWRKAGINANLRMVKQPALVKARDDNQLPAYFENNGSVGIADIGALLPNLLGRNSPSDFHHDPQLYDALAALMSTTDAQARLKAGKQAVARLAEQAYWVPLYEFTQNFLLSPDLDYPQAADGMQRLYLAKWKPAR
ncbi:ABC transporter substrate-binding protein [Achromobacter aloeverae]